MAAFSVLIISLITSGHPWVLSFQAPEDLLEAKGVRLGPELPTETVVLVSADPDRPSLWYAPCQTFRAPDGVRIWYQRVDKAEAQYTDQRTLCLGLWRDGQWHTPDSGGATAWGGPNNVVMRRSPRPASWGGFNVFQILQRGDQFEMLYWDQPEEGEAGAIRASSPDGINWQARTDKAVFTEHNDAFTLLALGKEFYLYQTALEDWPEKPFQDNLPGKRRVIALRTSTDLDQWSPQQIILRPDSADQATTEFYLFKAFPYRGAYIGLLMKYFADPTSPGKHSALTTVELLVSNDARIWRRPFRDIDLGFWTYADPFADGEDLCFVAWKERAMVLHKYRLGRLLAVTATEDTGEFMTPTFPFPKEQLALDVDARHGSVEVLLLDTATIPHRRVGICSLENVEGSAVPLWQGLDSSAFPLTEARLGFRLHNAKVYAVTIIR